MTQAVFGNGGYAEGRTAQPVDDPVEKALNLLGVYQAEIVKTVSQESQRQDRSAGLSAMKRKVDPTGAALGGFGAATGAGAALWGANSRGKVSRHAAAARQNMGVARATEAKRDASFAAARDPERPRSRGAHMGHANAQHRQVMERRNAAVAEHRSSLVALKRNKIGRAVTAAGVAGLAGTAAVLERRNRPQPKAAAPTKPAGPSLAELARRQRVEQAKTEADRYRSM